MKSDLELIGKFDSYIKKSLKNELKYCIREMKREHNKVVNFSDLSKSEERQLFTMDKYPSEEFAEKIETKMFDVIIRNELLYEALNFIKPKSREIILLKFWGEMTDYEVGQVLNMDRVAVTQNKNRTLNNLRKIIEELMENET